MIGSSGGIVESRLEDNGFIKYANGYMEQWGITQKFKTNDVKSVNYVIPFTSKVFNVQATIRRDGVSTGQFTCYTKVDGLSSFILASDGYEASKSDLTHYWRANGV